MAPLPHATIVKVIISVKNIKIAFLTLKPLSLFYLLTEEKFSKHTNRDNIIFLGYNQSLKKKSANAYTLGRFLDRLESKQNFKEGSHYTMLKNRFQV